MGKFEVGDLAWYRVRWERDGEDPLMVWWGVIAVEIVRLTSERRATVRFLWQPGARVRSVKLESLVP